MFYKKKEYVNYFLKDPVSYIYTLFIYLYNSKIFIPRCESGSNEVHMYPSCLQQHVKNYEGLASLNIFLTNTKKKFFLRGGGKDIIKL